MRQKAIAPASLRKEPEIFCWTLTIRRSLSARWLSKGTTRQCKKASMASRSSINRSSKLWGALCLARPLVLGGLRRRGRRIRVGHQRQELGLPVFHLQQMQGGQTLRPCFVGRLFHREQQGFEIGYPLQALFFC